jgi:hypothetical protein
MKSKTFSLYLPLDDFVSTCLILAPETAETCGIYVREMRSVYLLTPWSSVLLENLTGIQIVKKFPEFYGTRSLITAFTSARQLSLS